MSHNERTGPKRKQKRRGREIDGIVLLDKAQGISSNHALQQLKRLYGAAKAGHTGSLDPLATGMLPICFGEATKFSQFLLNADKSYRVIGKLGVVTTTSDSDGEVIERKPVQVDSTQLDAVLARYRGEITQVPSMYSALKHQGQPLYKLARQGIEVERKPRRVVIHQLDLHRFEGDEIELTVRCSKGTYVRNLIEDIGSDLGCGGHVTALRRLSVGAYEERAMVAYDDIEAIHEGEGYQGIDKLLLPEDTSVSDWPTVNLTEATAFYLRQGQAVMAPKAPTEGWVRLLMESNNAFIGVGEIIDDGRIAPRRLVRT